MYKVQEMKVITDPYCGGFCDEDGSIRFVVEIYCCANGGLREAFVSYPDNFDMGLSRPLRVAGEEVKVVNKTLMVCEEFLASWPQPLKAETAEELMEKFHQRLIEQGFFLASRDDEK